MESWHELLSCNADGYFASIGADDVGLADRARDILGRHLRAVPQEAGASGARRGANLPAMIEWVEVPDEAAEEMRAVNAAVEELLAGQPPIEEVGAEDTRRARLDGDSWMGPVVTSDDAATRTIETDIGPIDVRVVAPDDPRAVYLHLHGGGFVLGAADQQDLLLSTIAHRCGVAVVSVEYRLAPEHPFPAGPDDCEAAATWLTEHAAAEFGTDRLIIGGESAGAHLAALTLLRLRDRNSTVSPFVAANLVFGVFDLTETPSARNWGERALILSRATMAWFNDCFAPHLSDEQRRDPGVSPLYADLAGLVPALFTVGDQDPLLDDSLFMGARWRAAGNPAEVLVFPEGAHGFVAFPTAIATMATDRQLEFIARHAAT